MVKRFFFYVLLYLPLKSSLFTQLVNLSPSHPTHEVCCVVNIFALHKQHMDSKTLNSLAKMGVFLSLLGDHRQIER